MDVIPNSLLIFWAFFGVICIFPAVYVGVKYRGKTQNAQKAGK